jgi:MFS family permease
LPRLTRIVLGDEPAPGVAPVAAISFTYYVSFSTFWVYVGIYAVRGLHWPASRVGLLFLVSAPLAAAANYLSGRLSDRVGRKRLIVASFLGASANMALLALFGHTTAVAFLLIIAQGVIGAPAFSLDRVLVADLVTDPARREHAYATIRVATNVGILIGPPLAALLVYLGSWTTFLVGIAAIGLVGALVTTLFLGGGQVVSAAEEQPGLRHVARDRPFVLLLLSSLLGYFVYCCFETVLPVIAVTSYGLGSSTWGLLIAISPLLVILGQLRLTRATRRIPTAGRLAAASLLMGLPFLTLLVANGVAAIALVIVIFMLGEMVWMPTSQTVAAELAPEQLRGTYLGALGAMTGPAWTLAPFLGFLLHNHAGAGAVWLVFAAIAIAAAVAGASAVRAAEATRRLLR